MIHLRPQMYAVGCCCMQYMVITSLVAPAALNMPDYLSLQGTDSSGCSCCWLFALNLLFPAGHGGDCDVHPGHASL